MRPPPRRETFIALRARRQGTQIARDVLFPKIPPPIEPPHPVSQEAVEDFEFEQSKEAEAEFRMREEESRQISRMWVLGAVVLLIFLVFFHAWMLALLV